MPLRVVADKISVDPFKRNAELKILYGRTAEEITAIENFYQPQPQLTPPLTSPNATLRCLSAVFRLFPLNSLPDRVSAGQGGWFS
jgi:hypothetical protein